MESNLFDVKYIRYEITVERLSPRRPVLQIWNLLWATTSRKLPRPLLEL